MHAICTCIHIYTYTDILFNQHDRESISWLYSVTENFLEEN